MAQRPHVPKFGNWESEENVPYTAYFDKARKGKTRGKVINPNDPQENPDAFLEGVPPVHAPPFRFAFDPVAPPPNPPMATRAKHEGRTSREEGEFRRSTDSTARHDTGPRRAFVDTPNQRAGDRQSDSHRRGRISGGSERSIEHSPLHPHHQVRTASKGGISSPSWESRNSNEGHGLAPSTPNRSRLRNVDTPEKGAAVPRFGDWDESNPSSADGYSHIFNKVREEKHMGSANVPNIPNESSNSNGHKQANHDSQSLWSRCFPCLASGTDGAT